MYLWQSPDWPHFFYDAAALLQSVAQTRLVQGHMLAKAGSLQLVDLNALQLSGWSDEALATANIEGEVLQVNSVRASAARRLGLAEARATGAVPKQDVRTEATLDVLQAAVEQWSRELTEDDLRAWHAALFPTGRSGIMRIVTGAYRTHPEPMQIVTPRIGKPDVVHYEAPPSLNVPALMQEFLAWFNDPHVRAGTDGLLRAALAHLWFETIHPFEDGNGRIGRALAELALAQDMQSGQRLFSLSQQLWHDRAGYYAQLQGMTGQGSLDATAWVQWFVQRVGLACEESVRQMDGAVDRSRFWAELNAAHPQLSASQKKIIAKLFDAGPEGFIGGMSTEKYVNISGVSRATAYRELTELTEAGLLERTGQGRGTRYQLRQT